MSSPLWDKGNAEIDARIMRFCAGEDVVLDRQLFLYDIQASKAHVRGLERIELLSEEERDSLLEGLDALAGEFERGEFVLDERFEDGHSAIEAYLTDKLGDVGRKVHTGRSRNDQVLVASRLYLRDTLDELAKHCKRAAEICLERAANDDVPMPGYTHLQRAVPSSTGMWFAAFAEAFIDNARLAKHTRTFVDSNPLGTAAGYGVNLPLDRDGVTDELDFERVQLSPIYAQNSRGKFELQALMALGQALLDVRRLAWDLSLFTTREFSFVELPDRFTTGSSIMPNKRNPDVVELLRASYGVVQGAMAELQSLLSLSSGYHRDLQASKPPVLRAMTRGLDALAIVSELLGALEFDAERMAEAIEPEMYATDRAVELARDGVPFREAYRQVAGAWDELASRTPQQSLDARTSPGGAADLRLDVLRERLANL
ncbi:argininosuccinate lyase [Persicimonas caeni]|uniref:Argininosuccinate lyase n=1 Tax=Persicimonas caeni TaxID=2292766 RepID=A0A4Y6PWZ4_PERCE|nr:argininosuccinate lyase [Persicimonas caeni]QDG52842.1 argininosuccinate lyase [Persicimonas caeni]QED34064.1 argininosuccinate lyase [Persicimonas caeni]